MSKKFHRIRGDSLDEAYQTMRRTLGPEAVVLRTTQVKEGGLLGFLGRTKCEITASAPDEGPVRARKLSPVEKRYAANASIGSDERFSSTVAHFQNVVKTTKEPAPGPARTPVRAPAKASLAVAEAPVIPFQRIGQSEPDSPSLQQEIREMREVLDVLVAQSPGSGLSRESAPFYRDLVERGVSKKLSVALINRLLKEAGPRILQDPEAARAGLRREIEQQIRTTGGIRITPGKCRVVAFIGTTGVGKTTSLAKLAAHYAVRRETRVALVTTDTYRVAAPDQLKVYADIIGLPMKVANDAREAVLAVRGFRDYDLVLVDTAGGSQFDVRHIRESKEVLSAIGADEVLLMLGLGAQIDDLRHIVANFRCLRPTSLMFSKLDETRQFGAMFTLISESRLPVSYLSIGQDVPDDIRVARGGAMADLIVKGRKRRGQAS